MKLCLCMFEHNESKGKNACLSLWQPNWTSFLRTVMKNTWSITKMEVLQGYVSDTVIKIFQGKCFAHDSIIIFGKCDMYSWLFIVFRDMLFSLFLEISSTRRLIPKRNRNATTMTDCCWRTTKVATNNSSLRYLLRLPLTWTLTVMHIRSVSDLFCTFLRQTYVSEQCSTHSNLDVFISAKFFSHNLLCSLKVKQQSSEYHVFVSIRDATWGTKISSPSSTSRTDYCVISCTLVVITFLCLVC